MQMPMVKCAWCCEATCREYTVRYWPFICIGNVFTSAVYAPKALAVLKVFLTEVVAPFARVRARRFLICGRIHHLPKPQPTLACSMTIGRNETVYYRYSSSDRVIACQLRPLAWVPLTQVSNVSKPLGTSLFCPSSTSTSIAQLQHLHTPNVNNNPEICGSSWPP